jgi:peptidoglycan/LPS O-acetylase OafA/YrhL
MVSSNKIAGLDSLRFFAFLSVFLFHNTPFFKFGYLGIDFFFVLSSFLITHLALNEIKGTNNFSRFNFFVRRGLRIYPLYFLLLFFCFFVFPFLLKFSNMVISLPSDKTFYYFFLSNFDMSNHIFALKFLWSIAIEEQFYILFIFLSFFFTRNFNALLIALLLVYFLYNFLALSYNWNTYFNSLNYLADFAAGMCLAKLYLYLSKISLKANALAMIFFGLLSYFFLKMEGFTYFAKIPLSILFSAVILFTIKIFTFRFFNQNVFFLKTEYLGKYTFGLYVYSGFVMTFGSKFIHFENTILNIMAQLTILLVLSLLSYHLFEKPFLNLKGRFRFK